MLFPQNQHPYEESPCHINTPFLSTIPMLQEQKRRGQRLVDKPQTTSHPTKTTAECMHAFSSTGNGTTQLVGFSAEKLSLLPMKPGKPSPHENKAIHLTCAH